MEISTKTSDALENKVYQIATSVFNNITPQEQQSKISKEDVLYNLNNLNSVINSKDAFNYLTAGDGYYTRQLISAIESGMRDVLKDGKVTITDAPAIIQMVKNVAQSVNSIEKKQSAIVQIGKHSLLPIIQIIMCLVGQMMLPSGEYVIVKNLLTISFELLDTTLAPAFLKKKWNWPFWLSNKK